MICPFCKAPAQWVENKEIYGRNYGNSFMVWLCKPCNAYVGCHQNTQKPLGTMANAETREWRMRAHAILDPMWKSGKMTRKAAYARLHWKFGREIHIGESDIAMCKAIIEYLTPMPEENIAAQMDDDIDQDDRDRERSERGYEDHLMEQAQRGF